MDKSKEMKILESYGGNYLIRFFMNLFGFGIGSAIDVCLLIRHDKMKEKIFFNRLQRLTDKIDNIKPNLLKSEEFIDCVKKTIKHVIDTRRPEKIEMFAGLLAGLISNKVKSFDEYEEYLALLAELSYREIQILFDIEKFQAENPEPWTPTNYKNWDTFTDKLAESLKLTLDELDMLLMRMNRVGCSETFLSSKEYVVVRKCQVTAVFQRLKELVADRYHGPVTTLLSPGAT